MGRLKRSFLLWGIFWTGLGVVITTMTTGLYFQDRAFIYSLFSLLIILPLLILPLLYWIETRVLKPVDLIVESNMRMMEGNIKDAEIPPYRFVDNEIGDIMKTRNQVIRRLLNQNSFLEEERKRLEKELKKTAISRPLVGKIIHYLTEEGHLSNHSRFMVGWRLSKEVEGKDLEVLLRAYENMGLGFVRILSIDRERGFITFEGNDLMECIGRSEEPTGYLALGYLTGAVSRLYRGRAKGVERRCRSMGDEACQFIIHWEVSGEDKEAY